MENFILPNKQIHKIHFHLKLFSQLHSTLSRGFRLISELYPVVIEIIIEKTSLFLQPRLEFA